MDSEDHIFNNPDFYVGAGSGQAYYPTQDYSMGQGLGHGSFHDSALLEDDSPVEEMPPFKAKKPSKRAAKSKKDDGKHKEQKLVIWTTKGEVALCRAWCDVSKNSELGNTMNAKGFSKKVIITF